LINILCSQTFGQGS